MNLHEIGLYYNTDKAFYHNFCGEYEKYLHNLKNEKIRLLEVGVADGCSLNMWKQFFINGEIFGADINPKKYLESSRVQTILCDQEKEEELLKLPEYCDIIIDDGGHHMFQQQLTLKILFLNKLKPGGFYILEDVHTSLPKFSQEFGKEKLTLNMLNDIKEGKFDGDYFLNSDELNDIYLNIDFIDIIWTNNNQSITTIIKKKNI
jgi:hypothetical protein